MLLDDWRGLGKTFGYQGHSIFYRDEGSGPPLLCIHGFPTASWDWHALWPELTARFRVVAADMIGFGFSAKPPRHPYSILDQADLHHALLKQLGIGEAVVLAHDYGDTVAQELLARHEEGSEFRIRAVCFLNGGLFPEAHRARPIQKLLASPLGPLLARLSSERQFASGFAAIFGPNTRPTPQEMKEFWHLYRFNDGHLIVPKLLSYLAERRQRRERWVGPLARAVVPLRFVNGPEDPVSGRHMAARFREVVPNADVVLLEGIGHYPQVENPAGVLRAFLEFADRTA
jgi:pimeloyl-ACP methyl ester carboxylesterase